MSPNVVSLNEMEVLNISNMNSLSSIVLNDQRLLELIQIYSFLYNPRVKPFRDEDYDTWAWERITTAFNQSYESITNFSNFTKFTTQQLQQRWQTLKPIIMSLSKLSDITQIPEVLRQSVIKISIQLEDQKTDAAAKSVTDAQSIILDNMNMVECLPQLTRKRLEAEMVDVILSNGLDRMVKQNINTMDNQSIEREQEEFLGLIRYDELFIIKKCESECNVENIVEYESFSPNLCDLEQPDIKPFPLDMEQAENLVIKKNSVDVTLSKNWVPIHLAPKFIRRCVVRVRRTNLEDYLPLSKIKRNCIL